VKPGPYDNVSRLKPRQQPVHIRRVVLAIRIDLNQSRVLLPLGVKESRPHCATHPDIEWQRDNNDA
jgi:hypothetical protein